MDEKKKLTQDIRQAGDRLIQEIEAGGNRIGLEESNARGFANGLFEKKKIDRGTNYQLGWYIGIFFVWQKHGQDWPLTQEDVENWTHSIEDLVELLQRIAS